MRISASGSEFRSLPAYNYDYHQVEYKFSPSWNELENNIIYDYSLVFHRRPNQVVVAILFIISSSSLGRAISDYIQV